MSTAKKTTKRLVLTLAAALLSAALIAPSANAAFGFSSFDGEIVDQFGEPFTQAGGHPEIGSATFRLNEKTNAVGDQIPEEAPRRMVSELPPGLLGNPTVTPALCTEEELQAVVPGVEMLTNTGLCPEAAQVGVVTTYLGSSQSMLPLYNMVPPPGVPAQLAFRFATTDIHIDTALREVDGTYRLFIESSEISTALPVLGFTLTFWGTPADSSHDTQRGSCLETSAVDQCSVDAAELPFIEMPTSCTPPGVGLRTDIHGESWLGSKDSAVWITHAPTDPLSPLGTSGCGFVPFDPATEALPSAHETETPSGLRFGLTVPEDGILNPKGIAQSNLKKAVVTLPEGVTLNPSQAEGLGVCSPAQYESTELSFFATPGKGCPDNSKVGNVAVKSPLLEETIEGDVYVAEQDDPGTSQQGAENPFDSLLAIYVVLKNPERGILVKLAGEVEPDPKTGRIVTTFDDLPQLPFSSFDFKFREGARAPLVTPPHCGTYTTEADFYPWARPSEVTPTTSTFQITSGIGGAPCPPGGVPPFRPGFDAGSINNNAGSYSPFYMRLTRKDGEQDMTKFSSVLPPGVVAKIAGVSRCPDAAIAAAKAKTGREEQRRPSCPASSQIGRVVAGAGVGSVLTYVPGKLYLAGPYNGAPLSAVAITPAVAGPFDVGTVTVREALTLDPRTGEVHVDGNKSDPIPHILAGIPLKVRDLRVYVDRPEFTINPTSCDPSAVKATLFGGFLDVLSPDDDVPVSLAARFQAANCATLGFKPKLSLKLKGGTKRGGHPALKAVVTPRPGDANIGAATVTLPKSAFLDQAHIRTICTRVQFAADACPPGAIYGHVKAWTPLLDEPLEGPVYLRSSDHNLPDLVFDLRGIVDIEVSGRIDSVKGGIRSSFEAVPDAPVSKVVLEMQGGKKGLIVNSRNLCAGKNRADAHFTGQNGKPRNIRPLLKPSCMPRGAKR